MKNSFFIIIISSMFGFAQTTNFSVAPYLVDPNYTTSDENHYIVRNTTSQVNKLVLFIGGSFSVPANYSLFCNYAASIGFDVISLSYPNNVAAAPLGSSSDLMIFDNYREEIVFGTPVSTAVDVNLLNSITVRTLKLIQYLQITYPSQNWGQYLTTPTTLDWSKIIVAGHSQGSGHACYLGKKRAVDRVLLFSGPNDYHSYFSAGANWLSQTGVTSINKQFALLHQQDEIVPFSNQSTNLQALGMTTLYTPTLVDNLSSPYANSHFLYLNIPAISQHNSTIGGNSILPNIWNYMLTYATTLSIKFEGIENKKLAVYPNPSSSEIRFSNLEYETNFVLINTLGRTVLNSKINKNEILNIEKLPNGVYFLQIGNEKIKIIKE